MRLKDRIAIVTGGGSGLGAGIAKRFAEEGATLVLADINGDNAEKIATSIRKGQTKAIAVEMDVTDYDAAGDLISRTINEFGTVDILVNSAGTSRHMTFLEAEPEDFQAIMKVNLEGTMYCGQHAGRVMVDKGYGRIVNIASISGERAGIGRTGYGVSKFAVIGLTKQMALELGPQGVTVNAVGPGPVDTPLTQIAHSEETRRAYLELIPLNRYGKVEEMADAAAYLAGEQAAYVNGHILFVDGGFVSVGIQKE
ncbi:MAG: glucose 1-dehydrogenase [Pseudomonadota bacterium]|nr:glucose 1-dehydrogenase [Pseudomonadota bacterium]